MITIAINGACGRMGSRLIQLVREDSDLKLVAALERQGHPSLGADIGQLHGCGTLGVPLTEALTGKADVLIDFTVPESTVARAAQCAERGVAMVIGTTGLTDEQKKAIERATHRVPCFMAPNMSVGVNLLFDVAAQVAKALGQEYDIEIVEAHHRFKKDAPSGTALKLAEKIAQATGRDLAQDAVYGRHGITGERKRKEIGVHAVRCGDVVGDHTVIFCTLGERIELIHRAHTRDTFCRGALRAARFIVGKPPRLYSMEDLLRA